jgi:hypothetical protein
VSEFEFSYKSQTDADLLSYDGPVIPVTVTAPMLLRTYLRDHGLPAFPVSRGLALIDTGAAVSAVDESVMIELGIPAIGAAASQTPHGFAELNMYNASADFSGIDVYGVTLKRVLGGHFRTATDTGLDVIMLVGRDILRNLVVTYDGPRSRVTIQT